MWRVRVEYGRSMWLEAAPGYVTLSTKFDTLRTPYALLHIIAHRVHNIIATRSIEDVEKRVEAVAGALGGHGFKTALLSAAAHRYKASINDSFVVDLEWLRVEYSREEDRLSVKTEKEKAMAALVGLGSIAWPRGLPWPTLAPKTREGELRSFLHTYCETPWMRDLVEARKFLGLGPLPKNIISRLEELIGCSVELASWGIVARKYGSTEVCPMNPLVFVTLPFLHYARYSPYNLMLMIEDPGLHLNTDMMEALADILAALLEKGTSIVLWGEGAERLHRMLRERGAQHILA